MVSGLAGSRSQVCQVSTCDSRTRDPATCNLQPATCDLQPIFARPGASEAHAAQSAHRRIIPLSRGGNPNRFLHGGGRNHLARRDNLRALASHNNHIVDCSSTLAMTNARCCPGGNPFFRPSSRIDFTSGMSRIAERNRCSPTPLPAPSSHRAGTMK